MARKIIESNQSLPARNEDSHDILGTYQLVSNQGLMSELPGSGKELLSFLRDRHSVLLRAQDFSLTVRGENIDLMQDHLESCNAFQEPTEASLDF